MVGWIFPRTRPWHLGLVALTLGSWLVLGLGFGYGLGYCFLTDWHWDIMRARGQTNLPGSYTELLAEFLTSTDIPLPLVSTWTAGVFAGVVGISILLNLWDLIKKIRSNRRP